jgi:hypothetical protein
VQRKIWGYPFALAAKKALWVDEPRLTGCHSSSRFSVLWLTRPPSPEGTPARPAALALKRHCFKLGPEDPLQTPFIFTWPGTVAGRQRRYTDERASTTARAKDFSPPSDLALQACNLVHGTRGALVLWVPDYDFIQRFVELNYCHRCDCARPSVPHVQNLTLKEP